MEEMKNKLTLQDIKKVCDTLEIPYVIEEAHGTIYIYDKDDWKAHQEDNSKFVGYLRISHFGERDNMLYTRYIGDCNWMTFRHVWSMIGKLGGLIN